MTISEAETTDEYASAKALTKEYAASLGINLCFQNFSEELANSKKVSGCLWHPPGGRDAERLAKSGH
jgi:hypothetical protein